MKRSQRHHLKENELVLTLRRAQDMLTVYKRPLAAASITLVVVIAAAGGYFMWRQYSTSQAERMLTEALAILQAQVVPPAPQAGSPATPATAPTEAPGSYPSVRAQLEAALPKLMVVADQYPSATAGLAARYHAAAALAALGRVSEAEQRYNEVSDRAGETLYGSMAKLGLAEVQAGAGNYESAIAIVRELSTKPGSELPVDAILMRLGRTYAIAGKTSEALETYRRVVDEFPQSVYVPDAKRQIDTLANTTQESPSKS